MELISLGSRRAAVIFGTLIGILSLTASAQSQLGNPPKLVLFMVVDGFPQELVKYYDQVGKNGFRIFLDKGAW